MIISVYHHLHCIMYTSFGGRAFVIVLRGTSQYQITLYQTLNRNSKNKIHAGDKIPRILITALASWCDWCRGEVSLAIDIVTRVAIRLDRRRRKRATNPGRLRVQEVGRNGIVWASERSVLQNGVQHRKCPGHSLGRLLQRAGDAERGDGVEAHVDIAEDGLNVQVGCRELGYAGDDDVAGVDVCQAVGEGLDRAVGGRAAVPVLGPLLGYVFEVACGLVVLCADDGHDALVVGNATCSVGAVAEEGGVERERSKAHDLGEWEVVEVGVVLLGERSARSIVAAHDVHGELLVRVLVSKLDHALDKAGREVVVVSAAVVVICLDVNKLPSESG
jgi:hypothetical protein